MIELSAVNAIDNELTWVSERFKNSESIFVYSVSVEVLGNRTVIHVRKLTILRLIIKEQVLNINLINVTDLRPTLFVATHFILASFGDFTSLPCTN